MIQSHDLEKEIGTDGAMTTEVEEVAKAYNAEPSFTEKIRILSLIANRY